MLLRQRLDCMVVLKNVDAAVGDLPIPSRVTVDAEGISGLHAHEVVQHDIAAIMSAADPQLGTAFDRHRLETTQKEEQVRLMAWVRSVIRRQMMQLLAKGVSFRRDLLQLA